jgi:hypothetical protein
MDDPHTLRFRHLWLFAGVVWAQPVWLSRLATKSVEDERLVSWRASHVIYTTSYSHGERHGRKDEICSAGDMCRERACLAEKDLKYWLEEADEWARFKEAEELTIDDGPPRGRHPSS